MQALSLQVYTVSEIMGSFLEEIKDEGGTIHFCGAIDREWKSCLETITPDSPYMLLENGEYATLPENLNFIFEVDDLETELPENIVEQVIHQEPSLYSLTHRSPSSRWRTRRWRSPTSCSPAG